MCSAGRTPPQFCDRPPGKEQRNDGPLDGTTGQTTGVHAATDERTCSRRLGGPSSPHRFRILDRVSLRDVSGVPRGTLATAARREPGRGKVGASILRIGDAMRARSRRRSAGRGVQPSACIRSICAPLGATTMAGSSHDQDIGNSTKLLRLRCDLYRNKGEGTVPRGDQQAQGGAIRTVRHARPPCLSTRSGF